MFFKKGDVIVHPYHGVGKIIDIFEEEYLGKNKKIFYIQMERFTIKVDEEHAKIIGLRKVIDQEKAKEILNSISEPIKVEKDNWRKLYLKYKQEIKNDLKSTINVLKKILYLSRTRLLKPEEVKLMFLAKKIAAEEIATSLKEEKKTMMEKINLKLKDFLKKMNPRGKNALAG